MVRVRVRVCVHARVRACIVLSISSEDLGSPCLVKYLSQYNIENKNISKF